jgi:hypothetical protein
LEAVDKYFYETSEGILIAQSGKTICSPYILEEKND